MNLYDPRNVQKYKVHQNYYDLCLWGNCDYDNVKDIAYIITNKISIDKFFTIAKVIKLPFILDCKNPVKATTRKLTQKYTL